MPRDRALIEVTTARLRAHFKELKVYSREEAGAALTKAEQRLREREENRPIP